MIASLTISGVDVPLAQISVSRDISGGEMSMQIVGRYDLSIGDACTFVAGNTSIAGVITDASTGSRITSATASIAAQEGSGEWVPAAIFTRSESGLRAMLDFSLLPGMTLQGVTVTQLTHTMGTASPSFTEARF